MTLGIEQVWNEGVLSSQPNNSIESYHDIAADSDTAASIREILNGCTYESSFALFASCSVELTAGAWSSSFRSYQAHKDEAPEDK